MHRAGKSTVQRKLTVELYQAKLNRLYKEHVNEIIATPAISQF
jgi:hypothetical protein